MEKKKEQTAAERFMKVAEWLSYQDNEFTKNFQNSKSIMEAYKGAEGLVGYGYKMDESYPDFLNKNKMWEAVELRAIGINVSFGKKYFTFVRRHYNLFAGFRSYTSGTMEVYLKVHDNWDLEGRYYDTTSCIEIKDKGNAKAAYEKLVAGHTSRKGDDNNMVIGDKLKSLFEMVPKQEEEMQEGFVVL